MTYAVPPPYSPDLTPVEEASAKINEGMRDANPRILDSLYEARRQAIAAATSRDARGSFSHRARYLSSRAQRVGAPR